jgi:hypothetical protein
VTDMFYLVGILAVGACFSMAGVLLIQIASDLLRRWMERRQS